MSDKKKKVNKKADTDQKGKEAPKKKKKNMMTREKYNIMRKVYLETQSYSHAARAAGVDHRTARRYIVEGRPKKNYPAIAPLVRGQARKEEAKFEFTIEEFRRKYMKEIEEALKGHIVDIRLHNRRIQIQAKKAQEDVEYTPEVSSRLIDSVRGFDLLVRLGEHVMGGVDETINVTSSDFTQKMSEEEAMKYLTTGEIPEHLR